ncbi:hypothetical protein PR202_ga03751 [Eleusine coracana subsp. coracana]|uniref:protein-serine/threonine phosphatase n=1 Tax=Eleusine coracana subsp. coracana TaxID=191504 RepID=A0AAV5BP55_ELECO|nr:hypothetical protein PR202_ga03751 [Eleusine coracana subsp. coracana]
MLVHGARFLCSAAAAFARLAHALITFALMSLCSPKSPSTSPLIPAAAAAPWQIQARPTKKLAVEDNSKDHLHQPLLLVAPPPPALSAPFIKKEVKEKKTAERGRPPRLVIPPPVVARAAGIDPFGAAADRETDVATEVEVQGEGFCLASRRGVRHAIEDGYGVITSNDDIGTGSQMAFYGVYDGHGGRAAVDFVADKLGKNLIAATLAAASSPKEESEDDEVMAAIRSAYLTTDSEFLSQGVRGGACAATALVKDGELYVANVGDCRAVLCSGGGVATALTSDHTAGREDERRRIESSGGYVSCGSSGVWRVQDCLAVTRSFGDASMKPWVTGEPEVARRRLTPDCRFVVLASDGLWDKVSCQEAVDVVVAAAGTAAASVGPCKDLVAMARSRGSRDDVTVMVVDLQRFVTRR